MEKTTNLEEKSQTDPVAELASQPEAASERRLDIQTRISQTGLVTELDSLKSYRQVERLSWLHSLKLQARKCYAYRLKPQAESSDTGRVQIFVLTIFVRNDQYLSG